jgi:hypothetical protein
MIKDLRFVMPQGVHGPQVLEALVLTDAGDYRWKTVPLAMIYPFIQKEEKTNDQ